MRRTAIRVFAFVVALATMSCAPATSPSPAAGQPTATAVAKPASEKPAEMRNVKAAWTAAAGVMVTIWTAQDAGIFKKHGLNVELTNIPNGQQGIAALLSGQVDFLQVDGFPSALAAIQGGDAVVVASTHRKLILSLYARPDISNPQQLKGQAVGISGLGTPQEAGARIALEKLGLSAGDVTFAAVGSPADVFPAMESGRVAAGTLSYPSTEMARQRGYKELVDIGELADNVAFTGITTSRKFAQAHPDIVQDYIAAEIEAAASMLANRQEAINTIGKYLKLTDQQVLSVTYDIYAKKYLNKSLLPTADSFNRILEVISATVPKAKGFDTKQLMDDQYVKKLQQSGYIEKIYKQYGQEAP